MNRIHRIVFNHALGLFQVVSEHVRGRSRRKTMRVGRVAALLLAFGMVLARAQTVVIPDGVHEIVDGTGAGSIPSPYVTDDDLVVGYLGTSSLTIQAGGVVNNAIGRIGAGTGAQGTVIVQGDGSSWNNSADLLLGSYGAGASIGRLIIRDGGVVTNTTGWVGAEAGSEGSVLVTGEGSSWLNSDQLLIGDAARGELIIEQEGTVESILGIIGNEADSDGTVIVQGPGSFWINSDQLSVGYEGTGRLTIQGGASVMNTEGVIGWGADSEGTVIVKDAFWRNSERLFVGNQNHGSLTVQDGGAVQNSVGIVGAVAGSHGSIAVTGRESSWWNSEWLHVGYNGIGEMTIQDGGSVTVDYSSHIGRFPGSKGTVVVAGEESSWLSSGITVGDEGEGELVIQDGGFVTTQGSVSTGGTYVGVSPGSSGAITLKSNGTLSTYYVAKGQGSGTLTFDGGTLRALLPGEFLHNFAVGDVTIAAGGAFIDSNGLDIGIGAELSGSGGLTKIGEGVLTLSGQNGYAGATTVEAGTLRADTYGALVDNGAYVINGGTLDLSDYNESTGIIDLRMSSLSGGGGTLAMGDAYVIVDQSGETVFDGDITGGEARLYKAGDGTLRLAGQISGLRNGLYAVEGTLALDPPCQASCRLSF